MSVRATLLAALLLATPVAAAAGLSTDPSLAPSGTYEADHAHTRVIWQINHFGTSLYTGWFAKFDATFKFDPSAVKKTSLKATVDPKSVTTLDPKFDAEIAGPKFFDADKYPDLKFDSTSFEKTSDTTGKLSGTLMLHGVTKPVVFDVLFRGGLQSPLKNTYVLGFEAKTTIKRSEFGITQYLEYGLGDEVTITIESEFDHKDS